MCKLKDAVQESTWMDVLSCYIFCDFCCNFDIVDGDPEYAGDILAERGWVVSPSYKILCPDCAPG